MKMKKLLCVSLCATMVLAAAGCKKETKEETLKFGLGVYNNISQASNAEADANGQGKINSAIAVVTVDAAGKIVACQLDTSQIAVAYTAEGKAVANESFATKYELREGYNMKGSSAIGKEWYEQVDALETVICGKTLDEVKALVAEGNTGTDEVVNAGCTIKIHELVGAIEKAYNNAVASEATASCTLKVGADTAQSCTDATEEKDGQNQLSTTIFAAAVDAEGKVVAATSDCVQVKFSFDAKGASTFDLTKEFRTKKEQGTDYGMSAYGSDKNGDGVVKEWNEQAAAFDAACLGKTVEEIKALQGDDNYGNADLQTAGCTITVDGFVKAATKME
ncbi:MAG: hypothetical protein PUC73_12425 [Lachnospiraceae bacterium]|nr:hypothetical protein [Lachnospiraceae bacterium]